MTPEEIRRFTQALEQSVLDAIEVEQRFEVFAARRPGIKDTMEHYATCLNLEDESLDRVVWAFDESLYHIYCNLEGMVEPWSRH